MDVFALRERVVGDYRRYIESFVRIRDERVAAHVEEQFERGVLWPDAILQLNPAYEPGPTLDELAAGGVIVPATARFFRQPDGGPIRLYRHQQEAIEIAKRWEPYVLTTGTGSGKSLTYLVPIYDHIARTQPEMHRVRAIIVYPMNALINSQYTALQAYAAQAGGSEVRFAKYTGQEKDEERQAIQNDPPHILLTNYVMLEYMLVRPAERHFTDRTTANLEFLVLDELHVHRGRGGADVAMLMRRLRERAGNPRLLHVGTSATMASEGSREERKRAAAAVATKLFGVTVPSENVVDETLRRVIQVPAPDDADALRAAVEASLSAESLPAFSNDPLAAWVEETFGITTENGRLIRRKPITFAEGARQLREQAEMPEPAAGQPDACSAKLQALLALGNRIRSEDGEPVFAFRLHQFLAAGGTLYATLEPSESRYLTLEGQHYAPSGKVLYPLVFCRECGQEYYLVDLREGKQEDRLMPRLPLLATGDEEAGAQPGYLALDEEDIWSDQHEQELPDFWFEPRAGGARIKQNYRPHVPKRLLAAASGEVKVEDGCGGWFQPRPFLLCLRCGAAYDRSEKNDFRKVTRLSQAGRSTATTLVSASTVVQLRDDEQVPVEARKILSFTDNRQDASLQAGHFNDFVQVALVRAAVYKALSERGTLDHAVIAKAVFAALGLQQEQYAKESAPWGPGKTRNEAAMQNLLEYRLWEDLRRGWRIVQPNLEQCGLLIIDYDGLADMCRVPEPWVGHPVLQQASPETREKAVRAFLEHMRRELAIDALLLDPDEHSELIRRVQGSLREPWAFDQDDRIYSSSVFLLPGGNGPATERERSMGANSRITRYLRRRQTWGLQADLSPRDGELLIAALVRVLRGNYLTVVPAAGGQGEGVQLMAAAMQWRLGDGTPPKPDPVRTRWMLSARLEKVERAANKFFAALYRDAARRLLGVEGHAHTGQIPIDLRRSREERFRAGSLAALFCSPTMELGVDIRDLNVVHLRNIPPTPANYAQRSGRAGRGGQPALVMAFCSEGSPHDQYFYRHPDKMVAGAVAPARLDLGNEDLVQAHVHAVWLAATGVPLRHSVADVLDDQQPGFPLNADIQHRVQLSEAKRAEVAEECRRIMEAGGEDVRKAVWNQPGWIERTLQNAPQVFNAAFNRWRELYTAAIRQRDDARRIIDRATTRRDEREQAEQREREARRQIDLLLNRSEESNETDFYPYRYLAAEGFLPGYNFPRLPIRALVQRGPTMDVIDRPRFLALREFGPRNVIYHEGRKYRIARCVLPPGGVESRLVVAKFCNVCGYVHDGEAATADRCHHCGIQLTAEHCEYVPTLFEMTAVRGSRVERITCDEEERVREGFKITTHYKFAPRSDGQPLKEDYATTGAGGAEIMRVLHAPQATLWRVNQRWRRSTQKGFTLDTKTGYWARRPDEDGQGADMEINQVQTGIRPFVYDTRNVLLLQATPRKESGERAAADEAFLANLSFALQRGIQVLFQVEEQEVAVERIGEGAEERILFWEAAEGGTGVWPRLLEDQQALARVAAEALRICHFEAGGADLAADKCGRACYECLLSYRNQPDHPLLDRHRIKDYLMALAASSTARAAAGRSYDEQYEWLEERRDKNSSLEAQFLSLLYKTRRRLPDRAQHRPEQDVYAEADFYYDREGIPGICVFCDGPGHDEAAREAQDAAQRGRLEDLGYRVVVIRYDQDMEAQVTAHADVFGPGVASQGQS
jgi:ATP-dependent helicase YprA (DUF1998 family)